MPSMWKFLHYKADLHWKKYTRILLFHLGSKVWVTKIFSGGNWSGAIFCVCRLCSGLYNQLIILFRCFHFLFFLLWFDTKRYLREWRIKLDVWQGGKRTSKLQFCIVWSSMASDCVGVPYHRKNWEKRKPFKQYTKSWGQIHNQRALPTYQECYEKEPS